MQPIVDSVNTAIPMTRGLRRPISSLAGPAIICPAALPAMEAVSVSWIIDGVTE